mmetsp:Transcript_3838/g.10876  ORF Transcript_3838/g.10876 Transcript_3838/m.10876 type:complete len:248 (-) Transcript_3838:73-816(-)
MRLGNLKASIGGLQAHADARGDDGDVVLAAVGLLELLHVLVLPGEGQADTLQQLVGLHVHLPVGQEELGGRDIAFTGALANDGEDSARGHPDRVEVRDRGAGDDVATNGGGVADLHAGEPVQLVDNRLAGGGFVGGPLGDEFLALGHQVGEGDGGAKGDGIIGDSDVGELGHVAGADEHWVPHGLELHLDADLGVAHHQLGVVMGRLHLKHGFQGGGAHPCGDGTCIGKGEGGEERRGEGPAQAASL